MKKLLISAASLLLGLLAYSQEAELTIVPRVDYQFDNSGNKDRTPGEYLGGTVLYTTVAGTLAKNLSFEISNQWIGASMDNSPYDNMGRSDRCNWLQFAYLQYDFEHWSIMVGKNGTLAGGFENNPYDYDAHWILNSSFWNNYPCYQTCLRGAYTTPSEMTTLTAQISTSPFGMHPFKSGLFTYELQSAGEYGCYTNSLTLSAYQVAKDHPMTWLVSFNNEWKVGNFSFGLDYMSKRAVMEPFGEDEYLSLVNGHDIAANVKWTPSDKFELMLKGVWEREYDAAQNYWLAGGYLYYYPLKSSKDLRLHVASSYGTLFDAFYANLGITYYIHLPRK